MFWHFLSNEVVACKPDLTWTQLPCSQGYRQHHPIFPDGHPFKYIGNHVFMNKDTYLVGMHPDAKSKMIFCCIVWISLVYLASSTRRSSSTTLLTWSLPQEFPNFQKLSAQVPGLHSPLHIRTVSTLGRYRLAKLKSITQTIDRQQHEQPSQATKHCMCLSFPNLNSAFWCALLF